MNALPAREQERLDDIAELTVGGCEAGSEEYDLRARLRGQRNAMTALRDRTQSDTARCLAWLVIEYTSAHLYARCDHDRLREIGRFCHRLSLTALQAEEIDE